MFIHGIFFSYTPNYDSEFIKISEHDYINQQREKSLITRNFIKKGVRSLFLPYSNTNLVCFMACLDNQHKISRILCRGSQTWLCTWLTRGVFLLKYIHRAPNPDFLHQNFYDWAPKSWFLKAPQLDSWGRL